MPWQKMLFRNDPVWVQVGPDGRPILDRDGRAEMKYREGDTKTYRPQAANLSPARAEGHAGDHARSAHDLAPHPRTAHAKSEHEKATHARTTHAKSEHEKAPHTRTTHAGASHDKTTHAKPAGAHGARHKSPAHEGATTSHGHDGASLNVWTDGACSGNPGPMGIGVVVIDGTDRDEIGEYLGSGTNNIAELVAIERGLEAALLRLGTTTRRVRVHSDSSYAIGLLDKGWKAKANQTLVARIRDKLAAFPAHVDFVKVAGHAGVAENERCDELARLAVELRGKVARSGGG